MLGATPRGPPRMPAMRLPHGCEGLRVRRRTVLWTLRRPFMGRPVPRQLLRNALLDLTTIVPATAYHRRSYARDTVGLATIHLLTGAGACTACAIRSCFPQVSRASPPWQ